jgi:death on curing protein
MNWVWLSEDLAFTIHHEQLREHGGGSGLRSRPLLESALARPQQLAAYGDPDAFDLAAAYAFGLARNHPFVDGNKRTAWVLARTFLLLHNVVIRFEQADATLTMLKLAAGDLSETDFAGWLRAQRSG